MGFVISTTIKDEFKDVVEAIIENIKEEKVNCKSILIELIDNKLSMFFNGGFETYSYYTLSYLIQEIAYHYGVVSKTGLKAVCFDEGVTIISSKIRSVESLTESELRAIYEYHAFNSGFEFNPENIDISFLKPVSLRKISLFSLKRLNKIVAMKIFNQRTKKGA